MMPRDTKIPTGIDNRIADSMYLELLDRQLEGIPLGEGTQVDLRRRIVRSEPVTVEADITQSGRRFQQGLDPGRVRRRPTPGLRHGC